MGEALPAMRAHIAGQDRRARALRLLGEFQASYEDLSGALELAPASSQTSPPQGHRMEPLGAAKHRKDQGGPQAERPPRTARPWREQEIYVDAEGYEQVGHPARARVVHPVAASMVI